ncbi:MAG: YHS domain-containing protein [Acidobacteria bacterium]|nr:MAG: YHS domain-containing protein [Acidobacteriota bacterium]REK05649.1 MAG: YHS domain-containing protein [Acidobacteriota bacterium]
MLLLGGFASAAVAGEEPVNTTLLGNLALDGYDPVAYFTTGEPTRGERRHTLEWNGAKWRFASAENLSSFEAAPERYAPQYGGYCAWAVSQGYTADADPEAWKIVDGKLYLNYNREIQQKWEADHGALIEKADANWPAVLEK